MDTLNEHRRLWAAKPVLRAVYADCYRRIAECCVAGKTLELGGGIGNLKSHLSDIITTDIQWAEWMDVVADAQRLPFAAGSMGNIVMFDVLHHIEQPLLFLREAERVLRPGGRLVVCEPAITPLSKLFYDHFHPEPVDMAADPLQEGIPSRGRDPYESNQAIPTLLFGAERERVTALCPSLRVGAPQYFSLVVYPLSGGFRPWSLIPGALAAPLLNLEAHTPDWLRRFAAFRMLGVIERI